MRALILVLALITAIHATMNVGTFWFMQNNGKFLRNLPIMRARQNDRLEFQRNQDVSMNPIEEHQHEEEEVRRTPFPLWWDDFRKWNRLIKIKKCKYLKTMQIMHLLILYLLQME